VARVGGIASLVFGILLIIEPLVGAAVLTLWIGAYALVFGALLLVLASELNSKREASCGGHRQPYTRFTLPAVQVNSVLAKKYTTSSPVRLTRDMVWDMELQKAWDPKTFIPYVVSEAKSWGRHRLRDGSERFFRSSEQLGWITGERGTVLEEVLIDHVGQRILFLGASVRATERESRLPK
jgi:hypothetical protein